VWFGSASRTERTARTALWFCGRGNKRVVRPSKVYSSKSGAEGTHVERSKARDAVHILKALLLVFGYNDALGVLGPMDAEPPRRRASARMMRETIPDARRAKVRVTYTRWVTILISSLVIPLFSAASPLVSSSRTTPGRSVSGPLSSARVSIPLQDGKS
jgi:hypothetical protein